MKTLKLTRKEKAANILGYICGGLASLAIALFIYYALTKGIHPHIAI